MMSDAQIQQEKALIERLKHGDRPAFDALVGLYRNRGFAVAYRFVGNHEDAKDVLQEAFIKMYLNIGAFEGKAKFSTWFYRIVVNAALDLLRKRKGARRIFAGSIDQQAEPWEAVDTQPSPAHVLGTKEFYGRLRECVDRLSGKQKSCFILRYEDGLSTAEIAAVLHCRVATVKVHIFRAVRNLQGCFPEYFNEEGGVA